MDPGTAVIIALAYGFVVGIFVGLMLGAPSHPEREARERERENEG